MTATTASSSPADSVPDREVLHTYLRQADPGVLVAVLVQMTGDASAVDRYAPKIDSHPSVPG
jgi:hypothetical protein